MNFTRFYLVTIGLFVLITQSVLSQELSDTKLKEKRIDWMLRMYKGNNPGIVVSVMKEGDIIFNKAYGYSDIESKDSMTVDKAFNLAELSKMYTSVAILKLEEKKKLSLDDNLTDIFKGFPEYGKKIKIKNLLNHTSGLKNYNIEEIKNSKDVLDYLKKQNSVDFEPNTKQQYSNSDYALLAQIIEKKSKKSYNDYLNKIFFRKLSMKSTFLTEDVEKEFPANSYFRVGKEYVQKTELSTLYGEQGIYTNAKDYLQWLSSLYAKKIISSDNINKMFSLQDLNELASNNYYAYGWVVMQKKGERYYWHAGTDSGYSNFVLYLPDHNLTVLLLSNRNDGNNYLKTAIDISKLFEKDLKL